MKYRFLCGAVIFTAMALHGSLLHARSVEPTPEETKAADTHRAMLKAGQYAQLDKEMNQIQKEYEASKRDDINLEYLFEFAEDIDPALEDKFNAWVAAYPQSYAAHQSRAQYYITLAWSARGNAYADATSKQNFKDMEHYIDLAMKEEQVALKLTPKPFLTYSKVLGLSKQFGSMKMADEMLAAADAIDPHNYNARYQYMFGLQGRWGGSLEKMQQYRKTLETSGLPKDEMQPFDDMIFNETVWRASNIQQDYYRLGQFQTGL